MVFDWLLGLFSQDLAIDLGTANTLVYLKESGVVVNEPSVVVINKNTDEIVSIGSDAKKMYGKTPKGIEAIRPMKDGVIADFEITKLMIRHFIEKAYDRKNFIRPRMIICVPSGITSVEKKAVIESGEQSGARQILLIEEPMAAAIGSGLPVDDTVGNMVIDIGGGTTDVAVISMSGVVSSASVRVAGDEFDASIMHYLRHEYCLSIGPNAAEKIKIQIGSAYPTSDSEELNMDVTGIDISSGTPGHVTLSSKEVRKAISEPLHAIIEAVRGTVEQTPPELVSDIVERGITLTGGGALLRGLSTLITKEVKIPTKVSVDPLLCVVQGTAKAINDSQLLKKVVIN